MTEHEDPHQQPPRSKVRVARSHDTSDSCWPISRERNVLETPKLVGKLSTPRAIMRTSFKVKDKGQGHQADIMLRPKVRHIFRTERPTNFKLGVQIEDEDPYRHEGPSPARSKVKVAMSRGASDRCWPISLERKVPGISKLLSMLRMPRTMRTSFKVRRSSSTTAETKSVSYLPNGKF